MVFRSIIQNQRNVAYIFSGSLNSKNTIIERIYGKTGTFGGRMLTFPINPFTKETIKNYLNE
ncbi:MAG: ATP-binding protein partial [Methanobrevibacter sp. CfCl-M3]